MSTGFHAEIVADSICVDTGCRLTTMLWRYPLRIHAEVLRHRMLASSVESARARPWEKYRDAVLANPFLPDSFGAQQAGMQIGEAVAEQEACRAASLEALAAAVKAANTIYAAGAHKSEANRLLAPWAWCTHLITATDWENLWRLRIHPAAEIHFQRIATMARDAMRASKPENLLAGDWHLPFIRSEDRYDIGQITSGPADEIDLAIAMVSAARCARLSYVNHYGRRDVNEDLLLWSKLIPGGQPPHASPAEHPCQAISTADRIGPFKGWKQLRKFVPNENVEG